MARVLKVIDAYNYHLDIDGSDKVVSLARVHCTNLHPMFCEDYVCDMIMYKEIKVEISGSFAEIWFPVGGSWINLSDQMIRCGFALARTEPSSP